MVSHNSGLFLVLVIITCVAAEPLGAFVVAGFTGGARRLRRRRGGDGDQSTSLLWSSPVP